MSAADLESRRKMFDTPTARRDLKIAVKAGLSTSEAEELHELLIGYYRRLLADPAKIRSTHQIEVSTRIVVTGERPAVAMSCAHSA